MSEAGFLEDGDTAAEYQAFVEEHGLADAYAQAPRHERAALLLHALEAERAKYELEAEASEARGNPSRARMKRRKAEFHDGLIDKLFGIVHPPLINGQPYRPGFVACRYCGDWFSEKDAYYTGRKCRRCHAIATGEAQPSGPADQLEAEVDELCH